MDYTPRTVPNLFPTIPPSRSKIALIGEAPGAEEESAGEPFIGQAGRHLNNILSACGIVRSCCFLGHVMQVRPPTRNHKQLSPLTNWEYSDYENVEEDRMPFLRSSLDQLMLDLEKFQPNIIVLLGQTAFEMTKPDCSVSDWRGSLFLSTEKEFLGWKCLSTHHPSSCFQTYINTELIRRDLLRAVRESYSPELKPLHREILIDLSFPVLCEELLKITHTKPKLGCDIEGGINSLSCLALATSRSRAIVIPFERLDRSNYWTLEEETELWRLTATIMQDPEIKKVWQNGMYDRLVKQYGYKILVQGNKSDIMLKHFEAECEMEKNLALQTSLYTDWPYYKQDRKTQDQTTFLRYCGHDACNTFEIDEELDKELSQEQKIHCDENNELLNPLLYMEIRGIRYDEETAKKRLQEIKIPIWEYQHKLNEEARKIGSLPQALDYSLPKEELLKKIQEICCHKKDPTKPKAAFQEDYSEVEKSLASGIEQDSLKGRISILTQTDLNIKSSVKFKKFLYEDLGLPKQWKTDPKTKEKKLTTDYDSLLRLSKSNPHPALGFALELSRLRTRAQMLALTSLNGRVHCSYNLVGTETHRISSSASIFQVEGENVGTNMQTIPDSWDVGDPTHPLATGMRDLFIADEGCYLAKMDLKGADGWTVGAYMKMLGDPTMLDDLYFGIKATQVPAYILIKSADAYYKVANDRAALLEALKEVKKDMWQYFVSKVGLYGLFYTQGWMGLSNAVFEESEGKVNLSAKEAKEFQSVFRIRYNPQPLHTWMQNQINTHAYPFTLTASNGFRRKFYGRKSEILGEALAHLPQIYTTQATLKFLARLWNDPDNRISADVECSDDGTAKPSLKSNLPTRSCQLRIEPMHQVHDEAVVQFRQTNLPFAKEKIPQWFDNAITIAGQRITIPYSGSYGHNWAMGHSSKVGDI